MGYDLKYGRVTTEYGEIPDDEPVFLFRAQDKLAYPILISYLAMADGFGNFDEDAIDQIYEQAQSFKEWPTKKLSD